LVRTGVNNYVRSHATCAIVDPGGASASNTVQYTPIYLPSSTINRIGVRSAPTGSYAATTYRLGLYTSGTNAEPSTLVIDAGTVNVNASNSNFEITISQGVTPGWHYLAVVNQNAGTWRLDSVSDVTQSLIFSNTTMATGVAKLLGFTQGSVSGALPATATPVASTSTIPVAWVRVA
jgi:hypothetical protein